MQKKRFIAATAAVAAVGLTVAACGNKNGSAAGGGGGSSSSSYGAIVDSVFAPASSGSGTLTLENSSDFNSIDPGDTYAASDWDVDRLWARTMMSYANKPSSSDVIGDLVTSYTHSADFKSWTYKIVDNAKFANGDPVTTKDVAYAIERSNWGGSVLGQGPTYFEQFVQNTNNYQGPYKSGKDAQVSGILTPDATTITFNLVKSVSDFNLMMTLPETSPVEPAQDTGATYYQHMNTTGAWTFKSVQPGKEYVLVPNTNFVTASDPNKLHLVRASEIDIKVSLDQNTIDQDILAGRAQADLGGTGTSQADQGLVLQNPSKKAYAADPETGFLNYLSLNTKIAPFTDVNCRQAVEYALNKVAIQSAMGGSVGAGQIATTIVPPTNTGYVADDYYSTPDHQGDTAKAKAALKACKNDGVTDLSFNIGYILDQKKTQSAAEAEQQELQAIGFSPSLKGFPFGDSSKDAGTLSWNQQNDVAAVNAAWGPDFEDGFGFFAYLLTQNGINAEADYAFWDDPKFDDLLSAGQAAASPAEATADYGAADKYALQQGVIVPLQYETALVIYSTNAKNVYVNQAYGMIDFAALGVG